MAAQNPLAPIGESQRTFGCEFEWCVAFLWEDEATPSSGDTAKVIRVPKHILDGVPFSVGESERHPWAFDYVTSQIADTLHENGLSVQKDTKLVGMRDSRTYQLEPYRGWKVMTDISIREPKDSLGFHWCPVEVTSPAAVAGDAAFSAITRAVDLLTATYRIQVNPTCGFHVHVGQGGGFLELRDARRIAGLLWAADPLLGSLHPPERRFNYWSQSIRERSELARGAKAESYGAEREHKVYQGLANVEEELFQAVAARAGSPNDLFLGNTLYPGIGNLSLAEAPKDLVKSLFVGDLAPPYVGSRERDGPRFPLPKYTGEDEDRLKQVAEFTGPRGDVLCRRVRRDPGVYYGARELLSCQGLPVIPFLLRAGLRPNYNFLAYTEDRIQNEYRRCRTVEFREAAGTMSGKWAATWARICVGVYDWAVRAPVDQYLAVLDNCDRAAKGGEYDVVDFLDQLGLTAESAFAEQRCKCNSQALWE